jgi:hypothetical protein
MLKGQENEMATDRPDQTEASSVVGVGVVQIETGVVFSQEEIELFNGGPLIKTRDFGTTLIRIGVFQDIEVRIATAITNYEESAGVRNTGLQPITVGTKIALHPEKGLRPELALIGHVTLPWIGDSQLVSHYIAPDFRLSMSHTLSERFSLGYNAGMSWDGNSARGSFIYTMALGASVAGPVSAFAELYGDVTEDLGWNHNADFGITVLITPDLQFDTSYGFALDGDNSFFNAGVSMRFGK